MENISLTDSSIDLLSEFSNFASLAANLAEAYSSFILLPTHLVENSSSNELTLVGTYSLSSEEFHPLRINQGLIGWVAKNKQPIHVSPFEHDSRTLGIYHSDHKLKSFIGVPIILNFLSNNSDILNCGVLTCDSKKSYAFSKLQGKLLENIATQIANTFRLMLLNTQTKPQERPAWHNFILAAQKLIADLGKNSIDILRIHFDDLTNLETKLGTARFIETTERFYTLISQTLPPLFPSFQLPNGELILILDNMMSVFYQNKIVTIANHVSNGTVSVACNKQSLATRANRFKTLEDIITSTAMDNLDLRNSYVRA